MLTEAELRRLCREEACKVFEEKRSCDRPEVAARVHERFSPPEGPSADVDTLCRNYTINDMLDRIVRSAPKQPEEEDGEEKQLLFPFPLVEGYEQLRQVHAVKRAGIPCYVHIDDMTEAEGRARIRQLRRAGTTQIKVADEMERYFEARAARAVAAE